jgi:hypothetical protein
VGVSSDNGKMAIPSNTVGLGRASGQGCIISRFHDLRHTFTTWLTQCGVDYAVIQTLKGGPLPGSAKYYIHNWDGRLRDAVSQLETFTQAILSGKNVAEVPLTATQVPPYYVEQSLSGRKMVPRDRIELSTPAFSEMSLICLKDNIINVLLRRNQNFLHQTMSNGLKENQVVAG